MCDERNQRIEKAAGLQNSYTPFEKATPATESHLVYQLKADREFHIRKLIDIQKAIDAINQI